MTSQTTKQNTIWTNTPMSWTAIGIAAILLAALFWEGLTELLAVWLDEGRQEYSHGILIPVISLFLAWQMKNLLQSEPYRGSYLGLLVVIAGVVLLLLGELATLYIVVQYAFLITLTGLCWALFGNRGFLWLLVPLIYLSFMIPLPAFLYNNLSGKLQLISSELGVAVIRAFGITVFLAGNVIDLGVYKLQVVEACSGLRYLFPLASFAFLAAYLYKGKMWKRVVLFISSIPITILMNSFRIGIIGVLVEYFGIEQAEGFLHLFEGWVIFMACVAILLAEIWLLNKIGGQKKAFREVFGVDFPEPTPKDADVHARSVPRPFIASTVILIAALIGMNVVTERTQIFPDREGFESFPLGFADWTGQTQTMEQIFVDTLNFTDYKMVSYTSPTDPVGVQFYAAYYKEQRTKGNAAHSPRSCIPGGGWEITKLSRTTVDIPDRTEPLLVNRLQIEKGQDKQLVYYYFKQRDRELTSEYHVKWFLFWDALTKRRTDGALVRFVTTVDPSDPDWANGDKRLSSIVGNVVAALGKHVPD
ncbi:MAG: VPLPA-CTERM-specific exosortase XrtD [Gammaproteobacteria bacterium]|nr:VPLPA-CTERM-specific exosortase XrtD [Gammaproteobacteria bacterium]MDH3767891.1 VPLPA-CTERM-specific exosortase XrtD [Gammaproteobacteria bacterium]